MSEISSHNLPIAAHSQTTAACLLLCRSSIRYHLNTTCVCMYASFIQPARWVVGRQQQPSARSFNRNFLVSLGVYKREPLASPPPPPLTHAWRQSGKQENVAYLLARSRGRLERVSLLLLFLSACTRSPFFGEWERERERDACSISRIEIMPLGCNV